MTAADPVRLAAALLLAAVLAAAEGPWRTDFPAGLRSVEGRPLALLFSTAGCTWCHRMLDDSAASAEVQRALGEVAGFVVDGDLERRLVAQLRIEAFPTLVLVNRKGELVRVLRGYLPAADLATALRVLALHGDEEGRDRLVLASPIDIDALRGATDGIPRLVALLGQGPADQRIAVREALARMPAAADALWAALAHRELGVRVDAAAALAELVGAPADYDPFAAEAERARAASAWRARGAIEAVP